MSQYHHSHWSLGRIIVLGLFSYYPQARFVLLSICAILVLIAALLFGANAVPVHINDFPSCMRIWSVTPGQDNPLSIIPGGWVRAASGEIYVHEAGNTGYCRLRHDSGWTIIDGVYRQKWWEIPSKYNDRVATILPPNTDHTRQAMLFLLVAAALFFGLWLPSTLISYFGHKLYDWYEHERG